MKFEDALAAYAGRKVEVIQPNQFIQGRLVSSSGGLIAVDAVSSNYIPTTQRVNVITDNVTLVRVLPQ